MDGYRARGKLPFSRAGVAACGSLGGCRDEGRDTNEPGGSHRRREAVRRKTHETIRRVTADIEARQQLNTAVSALMELVNELYAFSEQTESGSPARHTSGATQTSVLERPGRSLS